MKTITDLLAIRNTSNSRDRELLLAHVFGKPREWLLAHPETPMRPATVTRYRRLLRRLERGEPLPHLIGEHWFYGRPFTVNHHVLIPRPESELLVELVLRDVRVNRTPTHSPSLRGGEKEGVNEPLIVDVGTGSGCVAVTIAAELPQAHIIATDVSPAALRVARVNARRHGVVYRITFLQGNLLEPILDNFPTPSRSPSQREGEKRKKIHAAVSPPFHGRENTVTPPLLLIANLPYLTTKEWRALPRSLREYEPRQAFDGGPDGLRHFRQLCTQLTKMQLQAPSSKLQAFLEIDPRRKRALTALVRKTLPDWRASWHRDLAHRWRVLALHPKSNPRNSSTRNSSTHHGPTVYDPAGPRSPARSW